MAPRNAGSMRCGAVAEVPGNDRLSSAPRGRRPRVLYVVQEYPQISETYIENERRVLAERHSIAVIALTQADLPFDNPAHYQVINPTEAERFRAAVRGFAPDIVHGHYFHLLPLVVRIARNNGVPCTLRCHSFDILSQPEGKLRLAAAAANDDACLGILSFPFTRRILEGLGVRPSKIHDCWPVVDYDRFHDESPNGHGIMNVGAAIAKKNMEDFFRLGALLPERRLTLYAMGYEIGRLLEANAAIGGHVQIVNGVQPADMPAEYKRHEWLVYTGCAIRRSVGWPMAVAEAQASGVGVCMQAIRPDLAEYVGDCGYLFHTVADARRIVSQPFPEAKRQQGFEQARRSDVRRHIHVLEDLWRPHLAARDLGPSSATGR